MRAADEVVNLARGKECNGITEHEYDIVTIFPYYRQIFLTKRFMYDMALAQYNIFNATYIRINNDIIINDAYRDLNIY